MSTETKIINCGQCDVAITSKFMKCSICGKCYHFSPCCSVQQSTFYCMTADKKLAWRCHNCRERRNSSYHIVVSDSVIKQKRSNDNDGDEVDVDDVFVENPKKFKQFQQQNQKKDEINTTDINETMKAMMFNMSKITEQLESINKQLQNQQITLTQINDNVSNLSCQVIELQKENKEKEKRINEIQEKVSRLEQKLLERNIEINNINNDALSAMDIVKKITTKLEVELNDDDIEKVHHAKGRNKIVLELSSLRKKREIMRKVKRHRIDADGINVDDGSDKYKFVYLNDQLTVELSRLLWMTKKKAKEASWQFVWMRQGNIYARKIENTPFININCENDLNQIN